MIGDGAWLGRRCFVVGGGPSLRGFDFARLRGELSIGANLSMKFPSVSVANDARMIREEPARTRWRETTHDGTRLYVNRELCKPEEAPWADFLPCCEGWGVSFSAGIVRANNCGLTAINIAEILGASPIYLLGFDLKGDGILTAHHHDEYPDRWKTGERAYKVMLKDFRRWVPKIKTSVVNLNPDSALDCFPKGDINGLVWRDGPGEANSL